MSGQLLSLNDRIFDALIKEAEFIRNEALLCIENVRKMAIYSTYIAGFALPIIAGLLSVKEGPSGISSVGSLLQAAEKNLLVIQFVCLGVSLTCLAFLRIYVGNFLQIFTFAKYFRDHLTPAINRHAGNPDTELFHWENWLKKHRSKSAFFIGDSDLAAEPILISLYVLAYGAGFVAIGHFGGSFPISSLVIGAFILLFILLTYLKFRMTLRRAVKD
jgi:hypothetical protein